MKRRAKAAAPRRSAAGFTLLNVLVAMFVAGFGLLGMVRATVGVTAMATQNQAVSSMAALSNGFWGVVQANPTMLVSSTFAGSFTSANYTTAPAALQAWLYQTTQAFPGATITIATGPDAASGAACSVAGGCVVTMNVGWVAGAAPGLASSVRAQTFYYQFGL